MMVRRMCRSGGEMEEALEADGGVMEGGSDATYQESWCSMI